MMKVVLHLQEKIHYLIVSPLITVRVSVNMEIRNETHWVEGLTV